MKIKNLYFGILYVLFLTSPAVAQNDIPISERIIGWTNYHSYADTTSTVLISVIGDTIKIDTIKRYYHYGKLNKTNFIYHNNMLHKEMKYHKNRLFIENIYTDGKNIKRIVYSKKRPYFLEKIFYFNKEGNRYKSEFYNKKGELIKEICEEG